MIRRTGIAVALVSVLAVTSQSAGAQESAAQDSDSLWNFYVGAGLGISKLDDTVCDSLKSINTGNQQSCDDEDTGWKVYAGWQPLKNFSFEAGYVDLGETTAKGGNTNLKGESDGGFIAALAFVPGLERIGLFIKGGAYFYDAKLSGRLAGQPIGPILSAQGLDKDIDDTAGFYGLGLRLPVNDNLRLSVEFERFLDVGKDRSFTFPTGATVEIRDSDINLYTVGAVWMF